MLDWLLLPDVLDCSLLPNALDSSLRPELLDWLLLPLALDCELKLLMFNGLDEPRLELQELLLKLDELLLELLDDGRLTIKCQLAVADVNLVKQFLSCLNGSTVTTSADIVTVAV